MGSSESNSLKDSPQTGMIYLKVSVGRRRIRDKIVCFISGPNQNLFSSKMESISEYTKNPALLLKQLVLLG